MAENILVVEYEPRYTDRVKQALSGQPFTASFARDGDEALRALDTEHPRLVVLSSVVPKMSTTELIRAIRGRSAETQILLTVSGYNGKTPRQDAAKLGASDLLPKPYTETEFLGKVQQMLGIPPEAQLTSNDIFGDVLSEENPHPVTKKTMTPKDDIDKLVADSLAGVMPKKKDAAAAAAKTKSDVNKLVEDTLSGLERKKTSPGHVTAQPQPHPQPAPPPAPPRLATPPPDRIPVSQPVIPAPPPQKAEPEPTDGKAFGQYVLLEKIATGGMAEVWKARKRGEEGFQKIVAIKKILPHLSDNQDFIEMFVDEAKLAAQLNHNNIIHIYDLGKIQNSYFIAMEYVEGHDLKSILRRAQERDHSPGVELSLFIASKIAAALDYAHRKRDLNEKEMELVHRDVSPQNVLVSEDGDIKLCDFGIAKAASKASHTQAGALKGKLQYMAPEQAWGRNIDRRSDIFALATVLFEMLTGRKLFTGDNEMSILEQVREARVTPPSELNDEVTPEIDRIVLKALQKDPAQRYQTAGEMARDLDAVLYNFRPTPTSADLAIYMHRLWSPEPAQPVHEAPPPVVEAPKPAAKPVPVPIPPPAAPIPSTPPGVVMPSWEAPSHAAKRRSPVVPLVIVGVLIAGIVGAYFYVRSRENGAPQVASAATMPASATTPVTSAAPAETGTLVELTNTATTATVATTTTAAPATATLDPSLVDREVQRLLAAERTRLEQQRQAQTATVAPPPAPRPAPVPAPVPTQTVAPPQETATVATQPIPEPAPVQPTETVPQVTRAREGDLVPPGTEGLTPARVTRFATVPYPPMARAQKVQGTVLLNVLVSETGRVLDVKTIRGINRPVGLNEAAVQIIRGSTFAPGMKDGVRVKSWATVPVTFKL